MRMQLLMATCEENGMTEIEQWLQNYYLSKCSLKDLSPEDQVKKIWQEFCKFDFDGSNSIDKVRSIKRSDDVYGVMSCVALIWWTE